MLDNSRDKESPAANTIALVARQSILDARLRVVAYELLYRTAGELTALGIRPTRRAPPPPC